MVCVDLLFGVEHKSLLTLNTTHLHNCSNYIVDIIEI